MKRLVAYIEAMRAHLRRDPAGWANTDLDAFLDGAARWTHDGRLSAEPASWAVLAAVLRAGAKYE